MLNDEALERAIAADKGRNAMTHLEEFFELEVGGIATPHRLDSFGVVLQEQFVHLESTCL